MRHTGVPGFLHYSIQDPLYLSLLLSCRLVEIIDSVLEHKDPVHLFLKVFGMLCSQIIELLNFADEQFPPFCKRRGRAPTHLVQHYPWHPCKSPSANSKSQLANTKVSRQLAGQKDHVNKPAHHRAQTLLHTTHVLGFLISLHLSRSKCFQLWIRLSSITSLLIRNVDKKCNNGQIHSW